MGCSVMLTDFIDTLDLCHTELVSISESQAERAIWLLMLPDSIYIGFFECSCSAWDGFNTNCLRAGSGSERYRWNWRNCPWNHILVLRNNASGRICTSMLPIVLVLRFERYDTAVARLTEAHKQYIRTRKPESCPSVKKLDEIQWGLT